jgi:PAS domain S-box-containing protein
MYSHFIPREVPIDVARGGPGTSGLQGGDFELLFSRNPHPMWIYDRETLLFLEVNVAAIAHYGYTRDEFLGMRITDIRPAEDLPRLLEDVRKRPTAPSDRGTWRHFRKDGGIIDVEVSSQSMHFAGRPAVLILAHDVTERTRVEESLRIEAQRLATVVTAQQDMVHEFAVDAIAQRVVQRMLDLTGADGAALGFVEGDELVYRAALGLVPQDFHMPKDAGLTGVCLHTGEAMLVKDLLADERSHKSLVSTLGVRSAILVPLPDGDEHVGVLLVNAARPDAFNEQDLRALQLLAGQVGAVMSRASAFEAQQRLLAERAERTRVLEQEVARRTAELETSNKELDAFAYSVSHDLRAPLRAIDGFSKVLQDRYADALDQAGTGYLERVRAASQKMSLLIDDLLQISRITRQEMRVSQVDLTAVATSIATELRDGDPERAVEWVIEDGLTARGDEALLRVVLANLLGNAWKFTSKNAHAHIEVGAAREGATTVFYVRDDGAGFDMTYAGKMFGAFQRLHTTSEFDGTGIGLATVQRIVHRHGGRIQAEGAPGRGAIFRFTLEPGSS